MNNQRMSILIVSVIGMIATFLPWVNAPFIGSINGTKGDGWFTLCFFLIPACISIFGDSNTPLKGVNLIASQIIGFICATIGIWKIVDFNSIMGNIDTSNRFVQAFSMGTSVGYGLYLLVIAGICLISIPFIFKEEVIVD
jgi:hypothetical protein